MYHGTSQSIDLSESNLSCTTSLMTHCNMVKGRILARRKQPDEAKTCLETAA
eukprot:SAG25_NODE_3938_length_924_cov_0.945455_2_plen_51_part_01